MYVLELAGEDDEFAAYEAECAASAVTVEAPGLAIARGVTDRVRTLAYTHRISELVGRCEPTVSDASAVLEAASLDRAGSVAVRAVNVRGATTVDTQATERTLGRQLVDRGFTVDLDDPDHELRVLFGDGVCLLAWLAIEPDRTFADREPGNRPFFQPGSMDPRLARALVNVAGARDSARLLDPMCGTGGLLLEGGLVGADVVGLDAQPTMVAGARENLRAYLGTDSTTHSTTHSPTHSPTHSTTHSPTHSDNRSDTNSTIHPENCPTPQSNTCQNGTWDVVCGDAASLPFRADSFDAVVFDTPYGRQSKIRGELDDLVATALAEARRVAPRCVVVGDRPWSSFAHDAGWQTEAAFDRRVHRSLTRYIAVLRGR